MSNRWPRMIATAIPVCAWMVLLLMAPTGNVRAGAQGALRIIVLEGEDAVNLIDKKTAVKPTVEVRDRNDLPIAGVMVRFAIRGRGAAFNNGIRQLTVTTDSLGRASVGQLTPIGKGTVEIQVNASYQGQTAVATIHQTNFATAADAAEAGRTPTQTGTQSTTASSGSGTTTASTVGTTTSSAAAAGAGAGAAAAGGLSAAAIAGIVGGAAAATAVGVRVATRNNDTPNTPPSVSGVTANPAIALLAAETPITFAASGNDVDADSLSYTWDFGDGAAATGASVTHVYRAAGQFTARVNVADGKGGTTTGQASVNIRTLTGGWGAPNGSTNQLFTITQNGNALTGFVHYIFGGANPPPPQDCPVTGTVGTTSPRVIFEQAGCQIGTFFDFGETLRLDPDATGDTLTGTWADHNPGGLTTPATLTRR